MPCTYLVEAKTMLINYLSNKELPLEDVNCIEYLIECIDYFLNDSIKMNNENLEVIVNDILVTGSYLKDPIFLKIAAKITDIAEVICQ